MQLSRKIEHDKLVVSCCLTPPSHAQKGYLMTMTENGGIYLWDMDRTDKYAYHFHLRKLLGTKALPSPPMAIHASNDGTRFLIVMK